MDPNVTNELASRIKFTEIVTRLEKASVTTNLEQKKKIVSKFFNAILNLQKELKAEEGPEANGSFYPFLRLFIPNLDLERGSFGIQTATLGRLFVRALAINNASSTAAKLTNLQGNTTDYGDIVYEVMRNRSPENGSLTVFEVNKYLDLIAEHFKQNQRSRIDDEMVRMLNGMSALDRKWLTRILLKKLRLGVGQKYMLELYHPKAWDLYNQYSHLSRVCEVVESNIPLDDLKSGILEIFKPIRPMLCERGYISQINRMLSENVYYVETKMDGERIQLHLNGTQFKYFSRSCKDELTNIFGASNTTGLYSPFFYEQLNGNIQNAIFDGEMMVWDREADIYLKKAENFTAKHLKRNDQKLRPCYCIYDLIYLDGENLTNKPYAERVRKLHTLIKEQKGSLMLCDRVKIENADNFLECLNKAYDANEEGVVMKQEDSKYHPGTREKGGWYKMKPDYENNLISDFDLIIIGGYYNDNKTAVDSFLLGVLKKAHDDTVSDKFYSVCKIRNGLKWSQFDEIREKLRPFQHEVRKNDRTSEQAAAQAGIEWANANPDFWVDPKLIGIVLQIKASEMIETTRYRTSHSFRFPRVMVIRWDKMWYDACTIGEFNTFCTSSSKVEKLTKRHATSNDLTGNVPKRQKQGQKAMLSVASTSNNVEAIDTICHGLDFCIVNCDKKTQSVQELENMVRRHGGKVVQYPNSKTFVLIAGNQNTLNVKKFINKKVHNIATPQWLVRALGSDKPLNQLIKFTPNDMVYATAALQEQFAAELDAGDETDTEPLYTGDSAQSASHHDTDDTVIVDIFQTEPTNHVANEIEEEEVPTESDVAIDEQVRKNIHEQVNLPNELTDDPYLLNTEPLEMDRAEVQIENEEHIIEKRTLIDEEPATVKTKPDAREEENANGDHSSLTNNERGETVDDDDDDDDMNIFRRYIGYFYRDDPSQDIDITFAQFMFIGHSGTCLETLDDVQSSPSRLTHIFVGDSSFDRVKFKETVDSFTNENLNNIVVMRYQWILDCNEEKKRICDKIYRVDL